MTSNFCKGQQCQTNGMGFIEIMFNISSREEMTKDNYVKQNPPDASTVSSVLSLAM